MSDYSHTISKVSDCVVLTLPKHCHENGNLSVVENGKDGFPFDIKRVYYLYDVPGGVERGGHSHRNCSEFIVAVSGSFDILLKDGIAERKVSLNRSNVGLLVVPGIWRELNNFSSGSVCLVLASELFDEKDYVRSYDEFIKLTTVKKNG